MEYGESSMGTISTTYEGCRVGEERHAGTGPADRSMNLRPSAIVRVALWTVESKERFALINTVYLATLLCAALFRLLFSQGEAEPSAFLLCAVLQPRRSDLFRAPVEEFDGAKVEGTC